MQVMMVMSIICVVALNDMGEGPMDTWETLKTEQGISECYLEGCLKHSGSISGFIHVFTQWVKASDGDGRLVLADVDEALARLLGELGAAANLSKSEPEEWGLEVKVDSLNLLYWLNHQYPEFPFTARKEEVEPHPEFPFTARKEEVEPLDEVIAQAAESLADPNFFIAEISGIISALVELKSVAATRRGR